MEINLINVNNKRNKVIVLSFYIMFLFAVWTLYNIFFASFIDNQGLLHILLKRIIKIVVWTIPVLLLIKYVYKDKPLFYLKFTQNTEKGLKWGVLLGALFIIYHLCGRFILGEIHMKLDFGLDKWIGGVILIGFTEEVVFRGFILQKIMEITYFWRANIISSVLFLLIHFPRWYMNGSFMKSSIIGSVIFVFVFALLQSYILKRTNSIWACIIVHSINNFIAFALM